MPVDVWIDYQPQVADEELGMHVTEVVEALPVRSAAPGGRGHL